MQFISLHPEQYFQIHTSDTVDVSLFQRLVDGHLEPVRPEEKVVGDHFVFVNSDSISRNLPSNYYASRILRDLGYKLMNFDFCTPQGVIVVCGLDGQGKETGLSADTIAEISYLHNCILRENMEQEDDEPEPDWDEVYKMYRGAE